MLVCGESRVGKSLMCQKLTATGEDATDVSRLMRRTGSVGFSSIPYEPTIGLDMAVLRRRLSDSTTAKVHIWDTSGDERYMGIVRSYYASCAAAIIVVDMADEDSPNQTQEWLRELQGQRRKDGHSLIIAVFGNTDHGIHPNSVSVHGICNKANVYFHEVKIHGNEGMETGFTELLKVVYDVYVRKGLEVEGISFLGSLSSKSEARGTMPFLPNNGSSRVDDSGCFGSGGGGGSRGCCSIL